MAPVADVGQPFAVAGGLNGKQGMLLAVFRDMLAGCAVVAATTHLKAKAGQVGFADPRGLHRRCSDASCLYTSLTFSYLNHAAWHGLDISLEMWHS